MSLNDPFGDEEAAAVDYLASQLPRFGEEFSDATVGVTLPESWDTSHPPHLSVRSDYTLETHAWSRPAPLSRRSAIRVVCWADTPSRVKRLARSAHAVMLEFPALPNTGVTAAQDPDNRAPIAFFTVLITQRPKP